MAAPLQSATVKAAALEAGFHEVGIASAGPIDPAPLDRVLAAGAEADMDWLRSQRDLRLDPSRVLPGARSVIALVLSHALPEGTRPRRGEGEVARYARGRDYHTVMKRRLAPLVGRLRELDPSAAFLASCDVAPVMEKVWAQRAGLGWVGKNGCFITPRHGSWVVLATILVDRALEPDAPFAERCGACSLCLGACPTGALPQPGLVDARRCISFWTIERRGPVPEEAAGAMGRWVFGCDECQLACPWNHSAATTSDPELVPRPGLRALDVGDLLTLSEADYRRRFHGTALARARFDGLVRNACLLAGSSGDSSHLRALRALVDSPYSGVREAAGWALARLSARMGR